MAGLASFLKEAAGNRKYRLGLRELDDQEAQRQPYTVTRASPLSLAALLLFVLVVLFLFFFLSTSLIFFLPLLSLSLSLSLYLSLSLSSTVVMFVAYIKCMHRYDLLMSYNDRTKFKHVASFSLCRKLI